MNVQDEIVIKVPSDLAQAYRQFSQKQQEEIQLKLTEFLEAQLKITRQQAILELKRTMDIMSLEAQNKGLTPEILEAILNDK